MHGIKCKQEPVYFSYIKRTGVNKISKIHFQIIGQLFIQL